MNLLEQLGDPYGAGAKIALGLFTVLGVVAVGWAPRIFRPPTAKRANSRESLYYIALLVVQFSLILMAFYFPKEEQERPETSYHYRSMADLAMWVGYAGALALLVLVAVALYGLVNRRDSPWHWPFMWLAMAQVALGMYAALAMLDHMDTYDFWRFGFTEVVVSGNTYPWALGAALVFLLLGAVNFVLARRTIRGVVAEETIRRYIEVRFMGTGPDPSRPRRRLSLPRSRTQWWFTLRGFFYLLTPFKLYLCHDLVREPRLPRPPHARPRWTWLDWFAASLAAMHGVTYTMPAEHDDPDEGAKER